jgi:single-strand DNA-binding protein
MNSVKFLGRATSDIELKKTNSGKAVATFSLAVKRPFSKDATDFFNMVAWERTAELLSDYVKKGTMVVIEGYLTNRKYEKDGHSRTVAEVIVERFHFCGGKNDGESNNSSQNKPQGKETAYDIGYDDSDDSLPF